MDVEPRGSIKPVIGRDLSRYKSPTLRFMHQAFCTASINGSADVILGLRNCLPIWIGKANGKILSVPGTPRAGVEHVVGADETGPVLLFLVGPVVNQRVVEIVDLEDIRGPVIAVCT